MVAEECLGRVSSINPGSTPFYMWMRRLYDTVDLRINVSSLVLKKRADLIPEYQNLMPLIYACIDKIMSLETLIHPEELNGVDYTRVIEMSKEYDLQDVKGICDSVEFLLQFIELYVGSNEDTNRQVLDIFYLVLYQLYFNIHIILGQRDVVPEYDIGSVIHVQRLYK